MTFPPPHRVRFNFITQLPRDDGCGLVVAQMLTGQSYDQIAGLIDWGSQTNHYMTREAVRDLLVQLDLIIGEFREATHWSDIEGIAFVHVEPDHYILYDGDNAVFYDPGLAVGPHTETNLIPKEYFSVHPKV